MERVLVLVPWPSACPEVPHDLDAGTARPRDSGPAARDRSRSPDAGRGARELCGQGEVRRPVRRLAQAVADPYPRLARLLHRSPGRRPGQRVPRPGQGVRRRSRHHADRRRTGQPGLCRVLAHGAGPLRGLHGQFPRTDGDLPHRRQLRRRPHRRRARRGQRPGPHARGGDRLYGPVAAGGPRQLHDPRLRSHRAARLLPQRRGRAAAGHDRAADRQRDRDGRIQRRLVRGHSGQAAVAVEGARVGAVGAGGDERGVPGPPRGAGAASRGRGTVRAGQPAAHAAARRLGPRGLRGRHHQHDQEVQRPDSHPSAVECIIQLAAANRPRLDVAAGFDPGTIASIEAEVPQITYDFTGGGEYGTETSVRTKEQADHDLRYLLAVALLDGNVMPAQFAADRITRPDVQSLMTKVSARPSAAYTDVYPQEMPAKITVRLIDGTAFSHEVRDYPGMPSNPYTWADVVGKFDQLVAGRIDSDLANQIKESVRSLERIQVKDLIALLARVRAG